MIKQITIDVCEYRSLLSQAIENAEIELKRVINSSMTRQTDIDAAMTNLQNLKDKLMNAPTC